MWESGRNIGEGLGELFDDVTMKLLAFGVDETKVLADFVDTGEDFEINVNVVQVKVNVVVVAEGDETKNSERLVTNSFNFGEFGGEVGELGWVNADLSEITVDFDWVNDGRIIGGNGLILSAATAASKEAALFFFGSKDIGGTLTEVDCFGTNFAAVKGFLVEFEFGDMQDEILVFAGNGDLGFAIEEVVNLSREVFLEFI